MKIVHLQHPYIPDKGYQENYLPKEQAKLGHDVSIISSNILPEKFINQSQPSKFDSGKYQLDRGITLERLDSYSLHGAATYSRGVAKLISREDPDIVHSHRLISLHTLQSILGNEFSDAKLFFDAHIDNDNFHLDTVGKRLSFEIFNNFIVHLAESKASKIFPVNPYCEQFLKNEMGISEQKIELLPLGVDSEKFAKSESERTDTRDQLGYTDQDIVFIFAGNIMPRKDLEKLLQAFSKLGLSNKELLVLGEGETSYVDTLHQIAADENISNRVTFHGFVPHSKLSYFYNAADIGVWPGKLGITIIEAISCGLPVILPKSPATEFLIDGNGLTYNRGDTMDLVSGMNNYGSNKELREASSKSAIELVQNELAWSEIAKQSIEHYKSA